MQNRDRFAQLILFTALLFGLMIRFAAPMTASGPVNDGGLFFQMTRDLQTNHFALPETTTYNHLDIPFVYPPLGFYLAGLLQSISQISLPDIFTYLPAIFSALAILAFYFLALQFTDDKLHASIAALFYAMIPRSFDWTVMGGGITRAPAMIFSFLTLAFAYKLLTSKEPRNILPLSICASLLTLSHPEITFQTAFSVFILALFFLRDRKLSCIFSQSPRSRSRSHRRGGLPSFNVMGLRRFKPRLARIHVMLHCRSSTSSNSISVAKQSSISSRCLD